jgi:hypothetical protein
MKQTAVEWLVEEMILRLSIRIENTFEGNNLLKKAKEMEKENIKQAYNDGKAAVINIKNNMSLEEYYDKTFKNETK